MAAILLVGSDPAAVESIAGILVPVGHSVVSVTDLEEALRMAADHQLVVVDAVAGERSSADIVRQIRSTAELASVAVLGVAQADGVDERIGLLEAGADDVIAKPFDARELEARVEALVLRFARSKDLAPLIGGGGSIVGGGRHRVVVFSPKGGTGTTTIAVNIAMAMAKREPDKVCLVDLDLQFGQALTMLNLTERTSLSDLVRDEQALTESELMRTYALRHDAGLHVLAAPSSVELAETISPEHVGSILSSITGTYDRVVVDAGSRLDERTLTAFENAESIVFTVTPDFPTLRAVHSLLDYLNDIGSLGAKGIFVLNHIFEREILKSRDIEGSLGSKVALEVPHDSFLYLKAANEGDPVVRSAPRSAPAERLSALARMAFGLDELLVAAPVETKKKGLFGRRH
ncbi:MAG TPA: AAA family ATPase [Candidatus Limnocylindrales bacterium]|nr:AAA family ATPase [Candidatus Limnocylindrales bacterium]